MKKILALILALMMVLALAACGAGGDAPAPDGGEPAPTDTAEPTGEPTDAEDDWAYIQDKGTLVIGYTDYAPMNYFNDEGTLIGFDTEFAEAVCEQLGITPEFVEIDWDTKEIELNNKNIDCIWNGFTITPEREENLDFTVPYMNNKQVVVVRAADAETYTDVASLASANLVAEIASAGETAILDNEELAGANYVPVQKQTSALMEVKAGTADAAVLDYTLATAMVGEGTSYEDLVMLDGVVLVDEEYGIGFREGSTIVPEVNAIIEQFNADGTMTAIATTYGLENSVIA
ncbi:MAG: transporter substrate-binding domain-containing protein [Oscillospiraceae bacterium]|nr:transporter substrate-binding domain-containing protein [Oscillospiraceae bacterium]